LINQLKPILNQEILRKTKKNKENPGIIKVCKTSNNGWEAGGRHIGRQLPPGPHINVGSLEGSASFGTQWSKKKVQFAFKVAAEAPWSQANWVVEMCKPSQLHRCPTEENSYRKYRTHDHNLSPKEADRKAPSCEHDKSNAVYKKEIHLHCW